MAKVPKRVLQEILSERLAKTKSFLLTDFLFKEQLDFVQDKARFATAVCSVRAGKSMACAADLINTALTLPGTTGCYVTLARSSAKRIIWPELKKINLEYNLQAIPNESDLSFHFPNGSWIYVFGASNSEEIEKIRGLSNVALVYLDESQSMRSHIKELVEDIITKRLYDTNGRCRMIGTPGPVKAGYFHDCAHSPKWAHHSWTLHKNPFIQAKSGKTVEELIEQDCERRGVSIDHPSIQRECFGRWTNDSDSLVFKYSHEKNHYQDLPELTDYVISIDLGSNRTDRDKDAIAVIGWHKNYNQCYLVEEVMGEEEGISPLVRQLEPLIAKYKPLKIVMDAGALGSKIADELKKRYFLPIQAAEKSKKNTYIALLNDALRTGRLKAKFDSVFAKDSMIIEWDLARSTSDRLIMKDDPHSDICDAVLYGYREALHWLPEPIQGKVNPRDRDQWLKHTEALMEQNLQRQIDLQQAQEAADDSEALLAQDPFSDNPLQYYLNKRRGN